jgi:hypothetical protein
MLNFCKAHLLKRERHSKNLFMLTFVAFVATTCGLFFSAFTTTSAKAQTLREAIQFLVHPNLGPDFLNVDAEITDVQANRFSVRSSVLLDTYTIDGCVIDLFSDSVITTNPHRSRHTRIDLNKVSLAEISTAPNGAIRNGRLRTSISIRLTGSDRLQCTRFLEGSGSLASRRETLTHCTSSIVIGFGVESRPSIDLTGPVQRLERAYNHIRENFCRGRAF